MTESLPHILNPSPFGDDSLPSNTFKGDLRALLPPLNEVHELEKIFYRLTVAQ
jgi:hypothetical protein